MSELIAKFQALDEQAQQEVVDFVDFLLEKKGRRKPYDPEEYKRKLQSISVWSDQDIKPIEEAQQHFNNWKALEW
ncbi:DUF2281 domain-containing protein [Fibrisoma montanum]|uniref:DUF2281 domain-containing protein n=1 Tax=Fibrisoma montanum TaxID=2305895 RepID=A0A418MJX9_9BACT|nr:DUF2281 domain-containing protein [Fibrisoma montanum]RIV27690.1 DUF2281 domain-containing protein [Fibrisoma montanum]